jgi:hypothetical protein
MSKNTVYTINMNGTAVATRSNKASAINLANETAAENHDAVVQVVTGSGTVVHEVTPAEAVDTKSHFKPWTRVEETDKVEVEVPAGYTVAYIRVRIGAVVARANDKSGWIVITEDETFEATNTAEAREITNDLAAKRKEAQVAAKEAADKAKAEAKAAKEAAAEAQPVEA